MRHRLSVIVFLLSFIVLITSIAHAQVDGVPVCTKPTNQTVPGIVPDGAGGAIIVWYDLRNGPAAGRPYVQRLNAAGAPQWGTDGIPVSDIGGQYSGADIVSDGAGGAILAWLQGTDVYMQRLNASGTRLWPTIDPNRNGVIVSSGRAAEDASITLDSTGGAIVAWRESSPTLGDYNIYAQRVSSDGIIQWDILHITVVTAPNDQYGAQLVSDGAGGAIMTWVDERSGFDIYMERLNSTGTPQWGTGSGVPLATTTDFGDPAPIIADGAGGAIITWEFDQANFDIAAQRVNAAGVPQWGGGVAVCTAANTQWFPRIVSDGGAGAIITWPDDRSGLGWSIFAQHLNASGVSQWTPNGKALSALISDPVHAVVPAIAANGAGGAIVAWPDNRAGLGNHDIYERNVTASGILSLPADGTPLCTAAGEQVGPSIESDGVNAIVTWQDQRSGNWDIYASPIGVLTGVGDTPSVSALSLTPNYPNPFLSRTSMSLDLPAAGDVKIEVFDVAGHRVRHADLGRMSAGSREMRFDGHDDAGRLLPSGVYFYRVHAGAETVTEKMVIAR